MIPPLTRLLEVSLQAAMLVMVILAVRYLAGRRLPAVWRHALWLIVLLRLLLPWTPGSRVSVYNYLPSASALLAPGVDLRPAATAPAPAPQPASRSVWMLLWLAGAVWGGSRFALQSLSTMRALRGLRPVTSQPVLDLLEDCKSELGVHTFLAIVETPHVRTPALFGWLRPRLLLPPGRVASLSRQELRLVLLHELTHLRRHDIAWNWLAAVAQTLHWFNPAVWLAAAQARADMELACDEGVLARLAAADRYAYGSTILKLVSSSPPPRPVPVLASINEDLSQLKRRIKMIADFRPEYRGSRVLAASLFLVLGAAFLVDARQPPPPADDAVQAAVRLMAVLDQGGCDTSYDEVHSYARTLVSRETYAPLCRELTTRTLADRGKVLSRKPVNVEIIPSLPAKLGDGVSVRFLSRYEKGEFPGPKILFAKDKDGRWRWVRSDPE